MRNGAGAFFLSKGPPLKMSHRDIFKFTRENAPYNLQIEIPLSAESGRGLCPLDPCDFLKKIE